MNKIVVLLSLVLLASCGQTSKSLNDAIKNSSEGVALISEEKVEEGRAKLMESKAIYLSLIEENPLNGLYHNNLGWVLIQLGDYSEAEKHLNIALENKSTVHPENAPETNLALLASLKEG